MMTGLEIPAILAVLSLLKDVRDGVNELKSKRTLARTEAQTRSEVDAKMEALVSKVDELNTAVEQLAFITRAIGEWSMLPWWKRAFRRPMFLLPKMREVPLRASAIAPNDRV